MIYLEKKRNEKREERLQDLWETSKWINLSIMGFLEGGETELILKNNGWKILKSWEEKDI